MPGTGARTGGASCERSVATNWDSPRTGWFGGDGSGGELGGNGPGGELGGELGVGLSLAQLGSKFELWDPGGELGGELDDWAEDARATAAVSGAIGRSSCGTGATGSWVGGMEGRGGPDSGSTVEASPESQPR